MTLREYAALHADEIAELEAEDNRERQNKPISPLEVEQEEQRQAMALALEVCRTYQDNIRKTGQLNTEILKGLQRGESLPSLFLKAVKALTLCTGNIANYDVIESTLLAVYGTALKDKDASELNAEAVRSRLDRLEKALPEISDTRERSRIEQAIEAHQRQLERLKPI